MKCLNCQQNVTVNIRRSPDWSCLQPGNKNISSGQGQAATRTMAINTRRLIFLNDPPSRNRGIQGTIHLTQDLLPRWASVQCITTTATPKQSTACLTQPMEVHVSIEKNWIWRIRDILGYGKKHPRNIIMQWISLIQELTVKGTQQLGTEHNSMQKCGGERNMLPKLGQAWYQETMWIVT